MPVKAVIDFVEKRSDLDASRIGMWGVSLGGYYAPRAAAFDKRIKACIALGGPFNWGAAWDGLPELTREAFRVRSHCKTPEEARKNANTLSLEGVAQNITCPLFIVNGRLDRIVPAKDAERLAREAKGPVELMMIEDGNHIATNRAYRWRSQSADWMKERLGEPHHRLCLHKQASKARQTRAARVHALDAAFGDHDHFAGLHAGLAVARYDVRLDHDGLSGTKRIMRHRTAPGGSCSRGSAEDTRRRNRAADRR